jgi:hypothetical protein
MKELPVEDHIRGVVKDLLRSRGIVHHGLETDINGAKQIPWKGLKYRLSLQVGGSTYMLPVLSVNQLLQCTICERGRHCQREKERDT